MSTNTLTLVIMAAGKGNRYGGLKQMDPVGPNRETIIDYSVYDGLASGFDRVVFIVRKSFADDFKAQVGRRFEHRADVAYAYQELDLLPDGFTPPSGRDKPWGTGHALLCAADQIPGPCAVINADDYYGATAFQVLADFLRRPEIETEPHTYAMVGYQLRHTLSDHGTVARGVCEVDPYNYLMRIDELTEIEKLPGGARNKNSDGTFRVLTGDEPVSMNFWGFTPAIFDQLREMFLAFLEQNVQDAKAEFYIPVSVGTLVKERRARVKVLSTTSQWFGMTYPPDKELVRQRIAELVERGTYPRQLWE